MTNDNKSLNSGVCKCSFCEKIIDEFDSKVEYEGQTFHEDCLEEMLLKEFEN